MITDSSVLKLCNGTNCFGTLSFETDQWAVGILLSCKLGTCLNYKLLDHLWFCKLLDFDSWLVKCCGNCILIKHCIYLHVCDLHIARFLNFHWFLYSRKVHYKFAFGIQHACKLRRLIPFPIAYNSLFPSPTY